MVTHLDTSTRTNLELPLRWHDLGVDTGNLDTGVETSPLLKVRHYPTHVHEAILT